MVEKTENLARLALAKDKPDSADSWWPGATWNVAPTGTRSRLSLANPPLLPNHLIVGTFHTHPHPASEGWATEPSTQDALAARHTGVPRLIRAEDGDHRTGPDSRRGGLGGGAGYPL